MDGLKEANNPAAVQQKKFGVMEIFGPTIQGEGLVAGQQTMFVRFGGCDSRCEKCDSLHAVLPELVMIGSRYLTATEIASELHAVRASTGVQWVTFSGGNPAIQQLSELCDRVHALGMKIAVETQGTIWADWLHKCDMVTVSPKGPGMGEKFKPELFDKFMRELAIGTGFPHMGFSVKIVIMDARDIEFAVSVANRWPWLKENEDRFWLSLGNPFPPKVDGSPDGFGLYELTAHYEILLEDLMQDYRLRFARILPQIHVLIWGNRKGV